MFVQIQDRQYQVKEIKEGHALPLVVLDDGHEFFIGSSPEDAGEAAARYYWNLVDQDPHKLRQLIGDETLINWAMGKESGPVGRHEKSATSLQEWIEKIVKRHPDVEFGHYVGSEVRVGVSGDLARRLGIDPEDKVIVGYCNNPPPDKNHDQSALLP